MNESLPQQALEKQKDLQIPDPYKIKRSHGLGLTGGILGVLLGALVFFIARIGIGFGKGLGSPSSLEILGAYILGGAPLVFSIVGLVGAVVSKKNQKTGGILMIIGGIGSILIVISPILLLTAGTIAVKNKRFAQSKENSDDVNMIRHKPSAFWRKNWIRVILGVLLVIPAVIIFLLSLHTAINVSNTFSDWFLVIFFFLLSLAMMFFGFRLLFSKKSIEYFSG
jgi:hypothetical protein